MVYATQELAQARSRHSVLVVDDDEVSRYAMARALSAAGFRTMQADGGRKALELADSVSAVVLDVHLQDTHGFEVCRQIRRLVPRLPVVHVSAIHVKQSDHLAGRMSGGDAYFVTPVDTACLADKLDQLIARR